MPTQLVPPDDIHHVLFCDQHNGTWQTTRHNILLNILKKTLQGEVYLEVYQAPTSNPQRIDASRRVADGTLIEKAIGRRSAVDATVVNPLAPSFVKTALKHGPTQVLKDKETRKMKAYNNDGIHVIPLAVDIFGNQGKHLSNVISLVGKARGMNQSRYSSLKMLLKRDLFHAMLQATISAVQVNKRQTAAHIRQHLRWIDHEFTARR